MTDQVPWHENATVVLVPSVGTQEEMSATVFEGDLRGAVNFIRQQKAAFRGSYRVGLPDRHKAPFEYQGPSLEALISKL